MTESNPTPTPIEQLVASVRAMPEDIDMVEHNPDEGHRYFCCGKEVRFNLHPSRGSGFVHAPDCWYVATRAALARVDAEAK